MDPQEILHSLGVPRIPTKIMDPQEILHSLGVPRILPRRKYKRGVKHADASLRYRRDARITVERHENELEYMRQYSYISIHPDCKEIPQRSRCRGIKHPDTRLTVQRKENRNEYQRQMNYIKNHPDCKGVPPKKWGTTIINLTRTDGRPPQTGTG